MKYKRSSQDFKSSSSCLIFISFTEALETLLPTFTCFLSESQSSLPSSSHASFDPHSSSSFSVTPDSPLVTTTKCFFPTALLISEIFVLNIFSLTKRLHPSLIIWTRMRAMLRESDMPEWARPSNSMFIPSSMLLRETLVFPYALQ